MTLDLGDCSASGAALPEPFLRFELEPTLMRLGLLMTPDPVGWIALRRGLRTVGQVAGPQRVNSHVVAPLAGLLGYQPPERQEPIVTREGPEDGGWLLRHGETAIRAWSVAAETGLDTPRRSGRAYRFGPTRSAQRVLRARHERAGLLTDGDTLRLLLCDPAEADSHLSVPLSGWHRAAAPDSAVMLSALASPAGIAAMPAVLEAARLSQARLTRALRDQARLAIEGFLQAVLDRNPGHGVPAAVLWAEGLVLVYRLLFVLKLESAPGAAQGFSFATTPLWRGALSPNLALGPLARRHLDRGHDTGRMLEDGLRAVFRTFRDGIACDGLSVAPLGGALFGAGAMPVLESLSWGERAVALLLDRLLWTVAKGRPRERVQYGALDVEDLGHIYEGLLELEPGIAAGSMVRLRRAKLEIVVPGSGDGVPVRPGQFYLRAGAGRKSTGSYYTPHALVRLLVRETLGPLVAEASPDDNPDPIAILRLRVVDPAAGSGHFLIEACRFLGDALYAACRLCDEGPPPWQARVEALRHIDPVLPAYLPTHAREGLAPSRAVAICRRLVAVHCLYGVDRNRLAIELAKLSLWLESYAEGLPLTFLDHRLVAGDSVGSPFLSDLATLPVGGQTLDPLLARGVADRLADTVRRALTEVETLNASIGRDTGDLLLKSTAKSRLDQALAPLRRLAQAWAGAVALGGRACDDEWQALAAAVSATGHWPDRPSPVQHAMENTGSMALPWDLTFPEIFQSGGFDAVLSNPPWDVIQYRTEDFVAGYDLSVLDAPTRRERQAIEQRVLRDPDAAIAFAAYRNGYEQQKRLANRLFGRRPSGTADAFHLFAERNLDLGRAIGVLLPSAFHASDSAAEPRLRYFRERRIDCLYSFENREKMFGIDSRFKFAAVVARAPGPTRSLRCAFYLGSVADLDRPGRIMEYDPDFLATSAGPNLSLAELRGASEMAVARTLFANRTTFGSWCASLGIQFGCDLHMTADAGRFVSGPAGHYTLHEGKTFHQYTDEWDTPPRYSVEVGALRDKPAVADAARHRRLAFRDIARATDERTTIAMIGREGTVFAHTATVEKHPARRPLSHAGMVCALMNSFVFDWLVRRKAATHVSLYLLNAVPVPVLTARDRTFLADATDRLSGDPARQWRLRAAADARIAHAYGLNRAQYREVLDGFSHRSFPEAPSWCLEAFDLRQGAAAPISA